MIANDILRQLEESGNMRTLPVDRVGAGVLDFSTNDYLGLAERSDLRTAFLKQALDDGILMTSSASRLLSATQRYYNELEGVIERLYGRPALMFNSGYHANSGLIPVLCDKNTLIVADRLVHASIIDGIMLSKCEWTRFRHNDIDHLEKIVSSRRPGGDNVLVIVESIYSMDGDEAPVEDFIKIKESHPGITLYIDEAHALGVAGEKGLGLAASCSKPYMWDVIVGTLGKAAASMGAFAVVSSTLRNLAINRCRSLIFSTVLPPVNAAWSALMLNTLIQMDHEREHLRALSRHLADGMTELSGQRSFPSHIQPFVVGDAHRTVELSHALEEVGVKVLPIRTPTVPPGTERLRISLSASMTHDDVDRLLDALSICIKPNML